MRLKGGYGYWRTDRYPIGGEFHRAPSEGIAIISITREYEKPVKGCTIEVQFADGTHGAISRDEIEQ